MADKPEQLLKITNDQSNDSNINEAKTTNTVQSQKLLVAEAIKDLSRSTGDISLYGKLAKAITNLTLTCLGYYIQSVSYRNFIFLVACTVSYSFFITFPQYWLIWWTEAALNKTWFYLGGYLFLSISAWVSTMGGIWLAHYSPFILISNLEKHYKHIYCAKVRR